MHSKSILRNIAAPFVIIAVICVIAGVSHAQTKTFGLIEISNNVTVNGQKVFSTSTIPSNSKIITKKNSEATISFGSKGRVRLKPESKVSLEFGASELLIKLVSGDIQVFASPEISAKVLTRSALISTSRGKTNSFTVYMGCSDTEECHVTNVEVIAGLVKMASTRNQKTQEIPEGTGKSSRALFDDCSKACTRPGTARPVPIAPKGALLPVLLGVIGATVSALILSRRGNETNLGGDITQVSPLS